MLTDKPITLTHKDFLIRRLSVKLMTSEDIIKAVVDHQFLNALKAMDTNNQVEFSGFGKYVFNTKKAQKDLVELDVIIPQLQTELLAAVKGSRIEIRKASKLETAQELQNYLKSKLSVQ